jgi:transcriptional regulator with XRE-family HTH domain
MNFSFWFTIEHENNLKRGLNMEDNVLTRIRELCNERNWTIYRLSKEADMSYSTLNNLFSRNNSPSVPTLQRVCDGFGISLSQFFANDKETSPLTDEQQELLQRYIELPPTDKALLKAYLFGLESKKA